MPIYAYRCEACGHAKDVLQKISDPVLTVCPACGAEAFKKQVTAAGFQLKGSGWYVTDFRGGNNAAGGTSGGAETKSDSAKSESPATEAGKSESGKSSSADAAPAPASPAASPPSSTPSSDKP
ncbi:MAG: FmdB family zinc ribbon protein [Rhizobacter sp.]